MDTFCRRRRCLQTKTSAAWLDGWRSAWLALVGVYVVSPSTWVHADACWTAWKIVTALLSDINLGSVMVLPTILRCFPVGWPPPSNSPSKQPKSWEMFRISLAAILSKCPRVYSKPPRLGCFSPATHRACPRASGIAPGFSWARSRSLSGQRRQ